MSHARTVLILGVGLSVILTGPALWSLRAQERDPRAKAALAPTPAPASAATLAEKVSVQEAMRRPFSWSFAEETTLQDVVAHLKKRLGAPVILDRAALARKKITPESLVRLELEGVRLKTGLKLLLDQVGLTVRVVPEDNLLILTDAEGADDTNERVLAELKSLHHDIHILQEALSDLRRDLGPEEEPNPAVRKPTIIEDLPDGQNERPTEKPARRPGL